jgi:hypothetical protein
MLVQSIPLSYRADAFASDFTPFTLIQQILERDGEFEEWLDEMTMSFGGFGSTTRLSGWFRESALDHLDFVLEGDANLALHAVSMMRYVLHHYLNRVGRGSSEHENEWKNRERQRCLQSLLCRYGKPASPLHLRSPWHHADRDCRCTAPSAELAR